MFGFPKPDLVYVDLNEPLVEDSITSEKYRVNYLGQDQLNANAFFKDAFNKFDLKNVEITVHAKMLTYFNIEVTYSMNWGDLTRYNDIRLNMELKHDKIHFYSMEYEDFSIDDMDIAKQIVKHSTTKKPEPFGLSDCDTGSYKVKNFDIIIEKLDDVEPLVKEIKAVLELTKHDIETNIKVHEMLINDTFQEQYKQLMEQQKQLTKAKRDLIEKTSKTVINLVSMTEDF
jgi:hypothetical protein